MDTLIINPMVTQYYHDCSLYCYYVIVIVFVFVLGSITHIIIYNIINITHIRQ